MTDESSLSEGCFVKNPKHCVDPFASFKKEIWDQAFSDVWNGVDKKLKEFNDTISSQLMSNLTKFTQSAKPANGKIPTAVLLTGVNLPDHSLLFSQLVGSVSKNPNSSIAMLHPASCFNLKSTVETMVGQLINNNPEPMDVLTNIDDSDEEISQAISKSSCNMPNLVEWFKNRLPASNKRKSNVEFKLVIIIPDFEGMAPKVLHDFLLILSYYSNKLPLVLILGVATSATVIGETLEHSVTSNLLIEIFQTQKSVHILNNVLDEIFLCENCPLQLGPKLLKFLTNTFLFYDFSVQKFTLGIKYCIMDHFLLQPYKILCTDPTNVEKAVKKLTEKDLEAVKKLESFKKFFESLEEGEKEKMEEVTYFKKCVTSLLKNCHEKLRTFYLFLGLLQSVISELPGAPLGKQRRELYVAAMSGELSKLSEYEECVQLMKFQSKERLLDILKHLIEHFDDLESFSTVKETLNQFMKELLDLDSKKNEISPEENKLTVTKNRTQFKEVMLALSKKNLKNSFGGIRDRLIDYLMMDLFPSHLKPVTYLPLHEIMVCETTRSPYLKRYLVGCHRGDVHHALTQPKDYLLCDCCKMEDTSEIPSSLPDICIVYKLHLECGALLNLHDWLQSFASIVDPESAENESLEISPTVQARFLQAVSDLEYMGFIKSSKRKADHVSRMTWGGSA